MAAMEVTYWMRETAEQHTPLLTPEAISFADVDSNNGFVGAVMLLWGKKIMLVEENWTLFSIVSFAASGNKKGGTQCKGVLPPWVNAFYEAIDRVIVQKFIENDEERRKMLPKILKSDVAKYYTTLIKLRERKNRKEGESETLKPALELSVAMKNGMFEIPVTRSGQPLSYPQQVGDFAYVPGQKGKSYKCDEVHWNCYDFYKINLPKWGLRQGLQKLAVRPDAAAIARSAPDLSQIRAMQHGSGHSSGPIVYQHPVQDAAVAVPPVVPPVVPVPLPVVLPVVPAPVPEEEERSAKRIKLDE
jgi:hypothetical protein